MLRNHRLATGQAVVYHKLTGPAGADIGGLTHNTMYYVIRIDSDTIKLAAIVQDVSTGMGITLTKPTADGTYRLTPIDARTVNNFTQAQINDGPHTITLHSHALVTGQAVRFHVQNGQRAEPICPTIRPTSWSRWMTTRSSSLPARTTPAQGMTLDITRNGDANYTLIAQDSLVTKVFTGVVWLPETRSTCPTTGWRPGKRWYTGPAGRCPEHRAAHEQHRLLRHQDGRQQHQAGHDARRALAGTHDHHHEPRPR